MRPAVVPEGLQFRKHNEPLVRNVHWGIETAKVIRWVQKASMGNWERMQLVRQMLAEASWALQLGTRLLQQAGGVICRKPEKEECLE